MIFKIQIQNIGKISIFGSQIFYFLRRWPLIPMAIMALLLITGIFAPQISPVDLNVSNKLALCLPIKLSNPELKKSP